MRVGNGRHAAIFKSEDGLVFRAVVAIDALDVGPQGNSPDKEQEERDADQAIDRVNAKLLFKACQRDLRPVAAASGMNLYMKMKKPMETTMLPIMAHEPISGFFSPSSLAISSRPTFRENFEATKPETHRLTERGQAADEGPSSPFVLF